MKKYLGVSMLVIAVLALILSFWDYAAWWPLLDAVIILVNIAAGAMLLKEKMKPGYLMFILPVLLLIGYGYNYGKWWMLINILIIVANTANGVVFLKEKQ